MRLLTGTTLLLTLVLDASAQRRGASVAGGFPVMRPSPPSTRIRPPAVGPNSSGGVLIPYLAPYPVYIDNGPNANVRDENQEKPPNVTFEIPLEQSVPPPAPDGTKTGPVSQSAQPCEAQSPPRPAKATDNRLTFFIALKGGLVYTPISYWVQDETLHYVTSRGEHNQVSLDLVDRQMSAKLNEGRGAELLLPPSK